MIFNPGIMPATGVAGAVTGSYTGDGGRQKNFSLGFEPAAILIMSYFNNSVTLLVAINGVSYGLGAETSTNSKKMIGVNFSGDGVLVGSSTDYDQHHYNGSRTVYNYIAIPKA